MKESSPSATNSSAKAPAQRGGAKSRLVSRVAEAGRSVGVVSVAQLGEKVRQVIAHNRLLSRELSKLTQQRDKLLAQQKESEQTIREQQQRIHALELGASFSTSTGDVREAKQRINRLLREIDSCIALMNR